MGLGKTFQLANPVASRGVAKISRRGVSKLVPEKLVGLQYAQTLVVFSERVYHFLDIYVSVVVDVHQRQLRLLLV